MMAPEKIKTLKVKQIGFAHPPDLQDQRAIAGRALASTRCTVSSELEDSPEVQRHDPQGAAHGGRWWIKPAGRPCAGRGRWQPYPMLALTRQGPLPTQG